MKNPDRIELKKIKEMQGRDSRAFSADFYFDGKHIGWVSDDGNGGCICYDLYKGPDGVEKEVREYCETLHEQIDDEMDRTIPGSDFTWKGSMIDKVMHWFLDQKTYKRSAKSNTIFRVRSEKGITTEYKLPGGPYGPSSQQWLKEQYPEVKGKYPNGQVIWIFGGSMKDSFTKAELKASEAAEEARREQKWQEKIKRAMKTKTLFRLVGDKESSIRQLKNRGPYCEANLQILLKQFGEKLAYVYGHGEVKHTKEEDKPRRQRGPCVL
jgi:hypothetical protein